MLSKPKTAFEVFATSLISIFAIAGLVGAATTIGTNISTDGTLTVVGSSSLGTVAAGTWNGTELGIAYGGTGATTSAAVRTNLGLAIGSNVQAYDAALASIAGLVTSGNEMIYTTGADAYATAAITAAGLSILDDATTADIKTTLGLNNVENTAISTWAGSANITTIGTIATGTWNGTELSIAYGGTGATTSTAARTNLGLAIGSNVQAYDAALASIAGLVTSGNEMIYTTGADAYATASITAAGLSILDDATTADIKTTLGLNNVENTAISTWAGSANITSLGTIATGTWNGTELGIAYGGTGATTSAAARTNLGLSNVENTALSTWAGSSSLTTLGTSTAPVITIGSGTAIIGHLSATSSIDFASMATSTCNAQTITVTGAVAGDSVYSGAPSTVEAGLTWSAYVSGANTITLRACNVAGTDPLDPAAADWRIDVWKH